MDWQDAKALPARRLSQLYPEVRINLKPELAAVNFVLAAGPLEIYNQKPQVIGLAISPSE
jgi:hypothetical protein